MMKNPIMIYMYTSPRRSGKKTGARYWLTTANIWKSEIITGNMRITAF